MNVSKLYETNQLVVSVLNRVSTLFTFAFINNFTFAVAFKVAASIADFYVQPQLKKDSD